MSDEEPKCIFYGDGELECEYPEEDPKNIVEWTTTNFLIFETNKRLRCTNCLLAQILDAQGA